MNESLAEWMRENMTPQSVALMVAHLQTVNGDTEAALQVAWFRSELVDIVGGPVALNELFEEVGV